MKITTVFILIFFLIVFYCCSDTGTTTPPPASTTCDQVCKDSYSAKALSDLWVAVMTNNIGLRYTGNHDTVVAGPVSGSVHVFGFYDAHSPDSGSLSYTFEMTQAVVNSGDNNMTFDGDVYITGTYSPNYRNLAFAGNSVKFYGNILFNQTSYTVFEQSCGINFLEDLKVRYGDICGRTFP